MPLDHHSTEQTHQPDQTPRHSWPTRRRVTAVLSACAILALPVGYLLVYYGFPGQVSANAQDAPTQSISTLEETVRTNPTIDNRVNLSVAYIQANQPGRAIPILDSVVAKDTNNALAWNNLCVANTMQRAYDIAIKDCINAVRIKPDFQLARNNLKWAEDEDRKAIETLATQEKVAPASRNSSSYLAEGLNFFSVGNYDQAIKSWRRVLELDPKNALAANNIGTALMLKKQTSEALPWFQKALSLDPTLQIAKNNLAWAHDELAKAEK
jgi:tetratricopeptide (TPR) repeat protein